MSAGLCTVCPVPSAETIPVRIAIGKFHGAMDEGDARAHNAITLCRARAGQPRQTARIVRVKRRKSVACEVAIGFGQVCNLENSGRKLKRRRP